VEDNVGRVGYFGPISGVAPYFEQHLGLPCPPEVNIADHIINETVAKKNAVLLGMHFILIHVLLSFSRVMIIFGFQCF
jgi:hypothetical protein